MSQPYACHHLHGTDRTWPETNCYSDLWIEVLHDLGVDPVAGLGYLLSVDFNGEQWGLFKYPAHDLQAIFGIGVDEIHIWRPLLDHLEFHLAAGRLLTIEVDCFYLPDLAGTTYRQSHQKTTIAVKAVDRHRQSVTYFHARGMHHADGDDFHGLLSPDPDAPFTLPPYVELVNLDRLVHREPSDLTQVVLDQVRRHLLLRPPTNPVERLEARVLSDLPWIERSGPTAFHAYAFGTVRQFGSWASTISTFVNWLCRRDQSVQPEERAAVERAGSLFDEISDLAKRMQYRLARVGSGRSPDLGHALDHAAQCWASAYEILVDVYLDAS